MRRLVLGRIGGLFGVLLFLTFTVFLIQNLLPADPVRAFFGRNASPELIAQKETELGYDDPLPQQYLRFLGRVVQGDLGESLRTRRPVANDIIHFLPATLELAITAAVFASAFALLMALLSARSGHGSTSIRVVFVVLSSAPTFFVAILGIIFVYRRLGWLPPGGRTDTPQRETITGFLTLDAMLRLDPVALWDAVRHLIMPALVLALAPAVAIGRTLRGSLRSILREDYIRTARVKGLTDRAVLLRHGLRNALTPTLAMAGLQFGLLLSGVVVVEVVFSWPGLGLYIRQAIQSSDFPAVVGVALVLGTLYLVLNALVDILQMMADPRLRVSTR